VPGPALASSDMRACDTYGHCSEAIAEPSQILLLSPLDSGVLTPTLNSIITSTAPITITGYAYARDCLKTVEVYVDNNLIDTHNWPFTPAVTNTQWSSLWAVPTEGTHTLRSVATDGHRLAMCSLDAQIPSQDRHQVIVPRKGILELARLLTEQDGEVGIVLGQHHIRATTGEFTFTSKLVDGKFPDYERVLPRGGDKLVVGDRQQLREAFSRTAILSNEKYRGIRLQLSNGLLKIQANNPEQEEAEEEVQVEYNGGNLEIGFNVSYLLDVLGVIGTEQVRYILSDSNSSALVHEADNDDSAYVVMPMRL